MYQNLKLRGKILSGFNKDNLNEFENIMKITKKEVLSNDGKLLFVYLPDYYRYYYKSLSSKDNQLKYQSKNQVISIIKNYKFLDIDEELFKQVENPIDLFPYGLYGHYNEVGYDLISKKIADF